MKTQTKTAREIVEAQNALLLARARNEFFNWLVSRGVMERNAETLINSDFRRFKDSKEWNARELKTIERMMGRIDRLQTCKFWVHYTGVLREGVTSSNGSTQIIAQNDYEAIKIAKGQTKLIDEITGVELIQHSYNI